jgi:hypothetical protein
MLIYPLSADVPEVVVYRKVTTVIWFYVVKRPKLKKPTHFESRAVFKVLYPLSHI